MLTNNKTTKMNRLYELHIDDEVINGFDGREFHLSIIKDRKSDLALIRIENGIEQWTLAS